MQVQERVMARVMAASMLLAGSFLGAPTAMAAAGLTATTAQAVSARVSYSVEPTGVKVGQIIKGGVMLRTQNISPNTINNVTVEATAVVADPQEVAEFLSSEGASCELATRPAGSPSNAVTVRCYLSQLKAGASTTFFLFYKSPVQDDVSPMMSGDYIDVQGRTITAEGADAGNSPNDSVDFWPLSTQTPAPATCPGGSIETPTASTHYCVKIDLGTPSGSAVRSAVTKSGGTLSTGNGGIPGYTLDGVKDLFTTTVTIPPSTIIASAAAEESPTQVPGITCTNFVTCFSTLLTIVDVQTLDGSGNPVLADYSPSLLSIVFRIDATNVVNGTKLSDIVVKYEGARVFPCQVKGALNSPNVPCINEIKQFKNRQVPGWTPALDGDIQIWALVNRNGLWGIE